MKLTLTLTLALAVCSAAWAGDSPRRTYRIETVAGSGSLGDGGPAIAAQIGAIQGVAVDLRGNVYLSDTDHHRVRKIDSKGVITTIAGTGVAGFSGDGAPAIYAQLNLPYGVAVDLAGNVYIADLENSRIRRVTPEGTIYTYAGSGGQGSSGDNGPAIAAQMLSPRNVAVDSAGNLYISEFGGHRVRKVTTDGKISTVAGIGIMGYGGDGGPATTAQLSYPAGLALDRQGNLYIADSGNGRIRKLLVGGQISTVLGGDDASGGLTLRSPIAVAVDLSTNLFIADNGSAIHEYTAKGKTALVAGLGSAGFYGDGGPAIAAGLLQPRDLAADVNGNLYIADEMRVRKIDASGIMHTIAGDNYMHAIGDEGLATAAILHAPTGVTVDGFGNLFIADSGAERVRRVQPGGIIDTVAGTGEQVPMVDGGFAAISGLMDPTAVAINPFGNLLIVETQADQVRRIRDDGRLETVIGTGSAGLGPELLPATQTALRAPQGVCVSRAGDLYVVDTFNNRILVLGVSGLVSTYAGNGSVGAAGDGGAARLAQLAKPGACTLDSVGNLYIADTYNNTIRKVDPGGIISTVAGSGIQGAGGDEGTATLASLNTPRGVAADDNGNIYIADSGNSRIRQVTPDGVIHTIAGTGAGAFGGDGDAGLNAQLNNPGGILLDGAGDLYFADTGNERVRRLVPDGTIAPHPVIAPVPLTVVNAASLVGGQVAPGEAITIFGAGLGPQSGAGAEFDSSGLLANQLAGVEVRFDGVPAPLFYVQTTQINVQVPYTVSSRESTHIEVFFNGQSAGTLDVPTVPAAPGIFSTVINQDGTFNSADHPAPRGTYLTIFGTGEGLTNGPNVSGLPAAAPYPLPQQPVGATVAGMTSQVMWAGSAPGLVGLLQVNLRVPGAFVPSGAVPLAITVGVGISPALTVWMQ